jgi:hypothetical protein
MFYKQNYDIILLNEYVINKMRINCNTNMLIKRIRFKIDAIYYL